MEMVHGAYFSVEFNSQTLSNLKEELRDVLKGVGLSCEDASSSVHVSLAYAEGAAPIQALEEVASRIADCVAREGLQLRAKGVEVLEGLSTPFDYLVLSLEPDGVFRQAVDVVEDCLCTRRFVGGFKSHVSLLRIKKGFLAPLKALCKARDKSLKALLEGKAAAQGNQEGLEVEGECLCVYDKNRECRLQVPLQVPFAQAPLVA